MGSNHGPKRYQHFALPTELLSQNGVTDWTRTSIKEFCRFLHNFSATVTKKHTRRFVLCRKNHVQVGVPNQPQCVDGGQRCARSTTSFLMREVLFLLRYLTEMVGSDGFEPPMPLAADLQSAGITAHPTTQNWLRDMDSNHDSLSQSQMSCRWTIPQNKCRMR